MKYYLLFECFKKLGVILSRILGIRTCNLKTHDAVPNYWDQQ